MRIYCIRNLVNGKIYIGSSLNWTTRKGMHLYQFRRNKHHSPYLQRAWNKYGKDNFVFEIIEQINDKNDLLKREQVWIDFFKPEYNVSPVVGFSMLGRKHTEEAKKRMSIFRKGRKQKTVRSEELKKSYGEWNKRPIQQLDIDGNVLKEYSSSREAANIFNTSAEAIQQAVKRNYRSSKFYWKYKDQPYNPNKKKIKWL